MCVVLFNGDDVKENKRKVEALSDIDFDFAFAFFFFPFLFCNG